jgi:fibrillarin-like pre-rRNA processing protein
MKEIFPGVFKSMKNLYTKSLVNGSVYGEKIIKEYREWDPTRSKLGAAILKGLKFNPIKKGSKILYLGASTGTTVSHISDMIEKEGIIYAIEFAERMIRKLVNLAEKRKNIVPLLADARKPEEYYWVEECDIAYVDLAQPDETEIAIRNAEYFNCKYLMIAIKSQSIDVTKRPEEVYKEEKAKLERAGFNVIELIDLEPYEHDHCFIVAKKML